MAHRKERGIGGDFMMLYLLLEMDGNLYISLFWALLVDSKKIVPIFLCSILVLLFFLCSCFARIEDQKDTVISPPLFCVPNTFSLLQCPFFSFLSSFVPSSFFLFHLCSFSSFSLLFWFVFLSAPFLPSFPLSSFFLS